MEQQKIWIITGASRGLGLAMVKYLLSKDQQVIATTRHPGAFHQNTGLHHPLLEVTGLDLTSETAVAATIASIYERYSRIDVLVNNAGYGFLGAVEEASQEEIAKVFDINVFASLRMVRHVLPYMRKARSGHIFSLSSIAGLTATPGFGIYNATKFAVEGFSEALFAELKELGIKVTIVEPGYFRTSFLDSSLSVAQKEIGDYDSTAGMIRRNREVWNGRQPGNPDLAAQAVFTVACDAAPPLRLLLGEDAYQRATQKYNSTLAEFERMKPLTMATAFVS